MSTYVIAEYLRLSSEDVDLKDTQKTESNSISNQRDLLNAHLQKIPEFAEAEVVEFCDDGWSGKNFERPAVQEMLARVRQGKIQCVIVKDLSRLGRDYLTVENYISRIFPFLGVRFISVNDGIDSIRPMDVDNLDTSFRALLYDLYSRDLSRKVRSAQRHRAQRGDFLSRYAPYGYIKDPQNKNHLLIDPPAAEVVQRIFHMVGAGHSTRQTAKALNRDGVLTPMLYKIAAGCTQKTWSNVRSENQVNPPSSELFEMNNIWVKSFLENAITISLGKATASRSAKKTGLLRSTHMRPSLRRRNLTKRRLL